MKTSTILSVLALAVPFASATAHRRHHHRRSNTDLSAPDVVEINKRSSSYSGVRTTFYDVGLGACGETSQDDQDVVALNTEQFGSVYPSEQCFKQIAITYGGKTVNASIVDECEACPQYGLDMSRGLFDQFADESVGVIYTNWVFL